MRRNTLLDAFEAARNYFEELALSGVTSARAAELNGLAAELRKACNQIDAGDNTIQLEE